MSSFKRKLERKKVKRAKKSLGSLEKELASMPDSCSFCTAKFNREKNLDNWMVVKKEDSFLLICDSCYKENKI